MANTPNTIRMLQRKLYSRSKQIPEKRFYSLYDKLYRPDILRHAYAQCRANKGSPGMDGISFEQIEQSEGGVSAFLDQLQKELKNKSYRPQPIKRVEIPKGKDQTRPIGIANIRDRVVGMACNILMQPVYDPHLHEGSYGYRSRRNAQQAVQEIEQHLKQGYTHVLDADITAYFDEIPQRRLIEKLAVRISDKALLKLIQKLIRAPIAITNKNGKVQILPNQGGVSQGAPLSPLMANVYLNDFCKLIDEKTPCKIVTYADDFVILSRKAYTQEQLDWFRRKLKEEGLTLNEQKTKTVNMQKLGEAFNFLGFRLKRVKGYYPNTQYIKIEPSKKSQERFKARIREIVKHRTSQTMDILIKRVNWIIQGWKQYYGSVGYPRKVFFMLDWFVVGRFYRCSRSSESKG